MNIISPINQLGYGIAGLNGMNGVNGVNGMNGWKQYMYG